MHYYAGCFLRAIVVFTLIGGYRHDSVITKWSDIDCTIQIFSTNYFKGDTVFSWRIKAIPADLQRQGKQPPSQKIVRVKQSGVKPGSLKTTGSCSWVLCSRLPRKKCSKVPGNAELPHQSEWKWVNHELAFVRLMRQDGKNNLEPLPLITRKKQEEGNESQIFPAAEKEDESSMMSMQIGLHDASSSMLEIEAKTSLLNLTQVGKVVVEAEKSESALEGPGEANESLERRKSETPEAKLEENAQKVIEYESGSSPKSPKVAEKGVSGFQGWRYKLQSILAEHLRRKDSEKSTSGKLLPQKPTTTTLMSTATSLLDAAAEQEAVDEVERTQLDEENKEASTTTGTTGLLLHLPVVSLPRGTTAAGSLLITREEEVDERQTFPMSNNNNNNLELHPDPDQDQELEASSITPFSFGVIAAGAAFLAFMAFTTLMGLCYKSCRKKETFRPLAQFDYNDDEDRSSTVVVLL